MSNGKAHFDISEVEVIKIKPKQGLVGVGYCVFNGLSLGHIGICLKRDGGYRLGYPMKEFKGGKTNYFYPINKEVADALEEAIVGEFKKKFGEGEEYEDLSR